MDKKQIVDTLLAKMYEQGGRCADMDGRCSYDMDGKKCLFSMALTDEARDQLKDSNPTAQSAFDDGDYEDFLFDPATAFLEGYEGRDGEFWQSVQDLHDTRAFWNDDALTEKGMAAYEAIVA